MSPQRLHKILVLLIVVTSALSATLIVIKLATGGRFSPAPGVGFPAGSQGPDPHNDPQILGTLPEFSLTERSGNAFGTADLRGKAWIADFVFTRCAGPCPLMTAQMAALQSKLAEHPRRDGVRLVSFSVDPKNDTPEALRTYADSFKADKDRWLFLTGERDAIWKLASDGFKLGVGEDPESQTMPIFHSTKFVLVDPTGRVRGYYDGLEAEGREKLLHDLDRVLAEKE